MGKTKQADNKHINLSGFYRFLKSHYRFPECRVRGIIACTGVILNKVQDLSLGRSDLEKIRHYIKEIGLTGDTINFYLTSFILYMMYMESARGSKSVTE
jgi:hypothetical protein